MDQRELINDQEEALRAAIEGFLLNTWTSLVGIVQAFHPDRMTCDVQVSIKFQQLLSSPAPGSQNPVWITMSVIPDVPIVFMGGGGFALTFTPKLGDECLVVFSSRCIDGWWEKGGIQLQPVLRHHSLSDGFCIIGPRSLPNVLEDISPNAQLRTVDGSAYIELTSAGKVNIVAPGGVKITGTLEVTEAVTGDAEGTFNSIPVSTHVHGGVATGGSSTGVPIP